MLLHLELGAHVHAAPPHRASCASDNMTLCDCFIAPPQFTDTLYDLKYRKYYVSVTNQN